MAVSAQVGLDRIYKETQQAVDLVAMFRPVTQWAELVPCAGAVPETVRRASKTAQTERPGAVYLAVPEDVANHRGRFSVLRASRFEVKGPLCAECRMPL